MKNKFITPYFVFTIQCEESLKKVQRRYPKEFNNFIDNLSTICTKKDITHDIKWGECIWTCNAIDPNIRRRHKTARDLICKAFGIETRKSKPPGYRFQTIKMIIVKSSQFKGVDYSQINKKNLQKNDTTYNLKNNIKIKNKEQVFEEFLDTRKIDLDKTSKNKLLEKVKDINIKFGITWLCNLFRELEQAVQAGHKLKYCIDVFCKSKYYQFKASALNLKKFNLGGKKRNTRTEDITLANQTLMTGQMPKIKFENSRMEDALKQIQQQMQKSCDLKLSLI